jgi:hypothetical protein
MAVCYYNSSSQPCPLSTIQTVTETLILLAKQAIHPDTVLVFPDDLFEVYRTPASSSRGRS